MKPLGNADGFIITVTVNDMKKLG